MPLPRVHGLSPRVGEGLKPEDGQVSPRGAVRPGGLGYPLHPRYYMLKRGGERRTPSYAHYNTHGPTQYSAVADRDSGHDTGQCSQSYDRICIRRGDSSRRVKETVITPVARRRQRLGRLARPSGCAGHDLVDTTESVAYTRNPRILAIAVRQDRQGELMPAQHLGGRFELRDLSNGFAEPRHLVRLGGPEVFGLLAHILQKALRGVAQKPRHVILVPADGCQGQEILQRHDGARVRHERRRDPHRSGLVRRSRRRIGVAEDATEIFCAIQHGP